MLFVLLQLPSVLYPNVVPCTNLQEREREDVDCVAQTHFALSLNDEERKTLEGAKVILRALHIFALDVFFLIHTLIREPITTYR